MNTPSRRSPDDVRLAMTGLLRLVAIGWVVLFSAVAVALGGISGVVAIVAPVVVLAGIVLARRLWTMEARIEHEALVVRNVFRTSRRPVAGLIGIDLRVGMPGMAIGGHLWFDDGDWGVGALVTTHRAIEELRPFVERLVSLNPALGPSCEEALRRWDSGRRRPRQSAT